MNAKDEAKYTMYRGIEQHFDTNTTTVSTIAALLTAFNAFKTVIAGIVSTEQLTNVNLSGITIEKSNSKLTLAQTGADVAAILAAYASATGNSPLEAEVNYTVTKLKRLRDEQIAPVCQIIHDRVVEHQAALTDYGITDEKIGELRRAIGDYNSKNLNPRAAVSSRKTQTARRRELFQQGDTILKKQIDKLIKNFRLTEPDFHNTYFNLREIHETSTTTTQLKGRIIVQPDGTPIKGAIISIVELEKTTKSDSSGEYLFKPIANGKFKVKITAEGYQSFEDDELEIKLGNINHLDVSLWRI
jgi:hypothetical protein